MSELCQNKLYIPTAKFNEVSSTEITNEELYFTGSISSGQLIGSDENGGFTAFTVPTYNSGYGTTPPLFYPLDGNTTNCVLEPINYTQVGNMVDFYVNISFDFTNIDSLGYTDIQITKPIAGNFNLTTDCEGTFSPTSVTNIPKSVNVIADNVNERVQVRFSFGANGTCSGVLSIRYIVN